MRLSAAAALSKSGVIRAKWWGTEMSPVGDTIHLTSEAVTSGPSQGHPGTHSIQIHRICTGAGKKIHLAQPSNTSRRGLPSWDCGRAPRLTCLRRGGACSDTGCRPHGTTAGSSGTAAFSGSTSRGRQHLWPSDSTPHPVHYPLSWALPPQHPPHSLAPSLTPQGLRSSNSSAACCSDGRHPSPALSVRTAGRASCLAWPGHKDLSSVRLPSAEGQTETSEAGKEKRGRPGRLPYKGQRGIFTLVAIAKTHWRQTQDVPSPSPGAGALGT